MSGTILLADDSLTIQKVVELTFADTEYRVVAVSSGDELLERLRDSQPDLIICDVIMPGKDGYEVCQQIKSSSEWLHLPVILLTGTFEPFDRDRAIAAGCSEIITKPFEARKLVDTVERLIGGAAPASPSPEGRPAISRDSESWPEEPTPADVSLQSTGEEFGTQLTPSETEPQPEPESEDDGIEFTTTGFAEMEAAGQQGSSATEPPEDGLEYELEGADATPSFDEVPVEPSPADEPDISAQTIKIDVAAFQEETDAEVAPPIDEAVAATPEPEPFTQPDDEPFSDPVEDEPPTPSFQDEPSMADTSPVDPPPEEAATPVAGAAEPGAGGLSEEDIDRIARRVVELASDRLEQIAWEVVPDMAEIIVRQRIRELEAEAESSSSDTVQ